MYVHKTERDYMSSIVKFSISHYPLEQEVSLTIDESSTDL